ncbi:hypothetical protein KCU92_g10220, partial [Aureobasidium melanogenum]
MNPPEGSAVAFPADSVAVDTSERQDTDPPRQKRKRISHACQACRQRKSRCDGARPVCQLCSQNGLVCQYSEAAQPPRAASPDRRTVTNLERRLHDMEATVRALVASQTNMQPMHDGSFCPSRASDPLSVHGLHNRRSSITHVGSAPLGATSQQASGLANSHDNVDGMVSVTFSDEKSSGTFGPTSNTGFLEDILSAHHIGFDTGNDTSEQSDLRSRFLLRVTSPPPAVTLSGNEQMPNPSILPPQEEIMHLVNHFFANTGKLFPYLYKPLVMDALSKMAVDGFQNVERTQLCVLNLIMAFATTHGPSEDPTRTRMARGDIFLQRALAVIPNITAAVHKLECIQALVLAMQYVQGTQDCAHTWAILGRLVTASLQVGMYQKPSESMLGDRLKMELRNRTWWMCFSMDKMCSMTFGRPPLIPNDYMQIDPPTATELEELAGSASDPSALSRPSDIPTSCLLRSSAALYYILGDIIKDIYGSNISNLPLSTPLNLLLSKVFSKEHDLSQWVHSLPPHITPITEKEFNLDPVLDKPSSLLFQVILTLRYLNVRMLLHRAVLSRLLSMTASEMNANAEDSVIRTASSSIDMCLEMATQTISIISQARHRQDILPVWWWSIYFSFTSALVIYGSILALYRHGLKLRSHTLDDLARSLESVPDVIGEIGGETNQVVRCQKIIRLLLPPAYTMIASMQTGQASTFPLQVQSNSEQHGTNLHANFQDSFFRSLYGQGENEAFVDLAGFSDELSSLFPSGF